MASPVGDSYGCASGGVIAAGRHRLPAWRVGQSVYAWREIAGSAMSLSPPTINPGRNSNGISSKMDAWCGLAIDTRSDTVWSLANGGHDDYHGNEVMKNHLGADNPVWIELLPSNSAAEFTIPNNAGYYSSGRPASSHTYYSQQFIESINRAVRFGARAASSSGNGFPNVDGYNPDVAQGFSGWDTPGTFPDCPTYGASSAQAIVKNPVTEDVYSFNTNMAVWKYTWSTNAWTMVSVGYPPIDPSDASAAYDTLRNRIFIISGAAIHHTFDPATGTFTDQTLTGAGASAVQACAKAAGLIYEPVLDVYLFRPGLAGGGDVYAINADTFAVTLITTSGGASLPGTAVISGANENVYNRFLYSPKQGGVFYFPNYSANAWFLRTH